MIYLRSEMILVINNENETVLEAQKCLSSYKIEYLEKVDASKFEDKTEFIFCYSNKFRVSDMAKKLKPN